MNLDMSDRIEWLMKMIPYQENLAYWCFDREGRLSECSSPHERIFTLVFHNGHYLQTASNYTENHAPVIVQGEMNLTWIIVRQWDDDGTLTAFHLIGPFYASRVPPDFSEGLPKTIERKISSERWKTRFVNALRSLPTISAMVYANYAIMLHYCVNAEHIGVSDLIYPSARELDLLECQVDETDPRNRLLRFRNTNVLLEMLREGNPNYLAFLLTDDAVMPVRTYTEIPLHNAQIACSMLTSLFVQAATAGGLTHSTCASISDAYIRSIFLCKTIDEVVETKNQMYEDLIQRVIHHKKQNTLTLMVQSTVDYIQAHLSEKLDLDILSNRLNYAKYYLSCRFKEEIGLSVADYMKQERLRLSKKLLENTELGIDEVALRSGFSSRSFYSTTFTKAYGISPAQYRLIHKVV